MSSMIQTFTSAKHVAEYFQKYLGLDSMELFQNHSDRDFILDFRMKLAFYDISEPNGLQNIFVELLKKVEKSDFVRDQLKGPLKELENEKKKVEALQEEVRQLLPFKHYHALQMQLNHGDKPPVIRGAKGRNENEKRRHPDYERSN